MFCKVVISGVWLPSGGSLLPIDYNRGRTSRCSRPANQRTGELAGGILEHIVKNDQNQERQSVMGICKRAGDGNQPVRIMGFVDGDMISPSCYDQPYCLQPSKDDTRAYDVLREVMHRTRKVGLAAVVIEKKHALAAVIPIGRTLVLNVLWLATGLVPGANRNAASRSSAVVSPTTLAPRVLTPATEALAARRRPAALTSEPVQSAVRAVPGGNEGEVIALAVRRTRKRAGQARPAKAARIRTSAVATLHELPRKPASRSAPSRQLA